MKKLVMNPVRDVIFPKDDIPFAYGSHPRFDNPAEVLNIGCCPRFEVKYTLAEE